MRTIIDSVDATSKSIDVALTQDDDAYLVEVGGRTVPLSTGIVYAAATVLNEDPLTLRPPLSSILDPDALDCLFEPRPDPSLSSMQFTLWGCQVFIEPPDRIHVERIHD
jgi:hypothetical protein